MIIGPLVLCLKSVLHSAVLSFAYKHGQLLIERFAHRTVSVSAKNFLISQYFKMSNPVIIQFEQLNTRIDETIKSADRLSFATAILSNLTIVFCVLGIKDREMFYKSIGAALIISALILIAIAIWFGYNLNCLLAQLKEVATDIKKICALPNTINNEKETQNTQNVVIIA